MLEKLLYENILIYIMIGIFSFGMLLNFVLGISYSSILRGSNNMGQTENKMLKRLKLKFKSFYKLKIGINNVDVFVDKNLNNHKIAGIMLTTWEKLCGQTPAICGLIAVLSILLGVVYEVERMWIISVFSVGLLTSGVLIVFESLLNRRGKREIIRINILDYLENYLQNRLEQEDKNPELIEGYKKEYLTDGDSKHENLSDLVAAGNESIQIDLYEEKTGKKEARRRKRQEKKAINLLEKQSKAYAKRKRKEARHKKKLEARRRAQEKKLRKKEKKRKDAELKSALKLEKQLAKSQKKAKTLTPAQQHKEILKKEIEELRQLEIENKQVQTDTKPFRQSDSENINNNFVARNNWADYSNIQHDNTPDKKSEFEVAATKGQEDTSNKMTDKQSATNKRTISSRTKSLANLTKQDEEIIEDILREYLA